MEIATRTGWKEENMIILLEADVLLLANTKLEIPTRENSDWLINFMGWIIQTAMHFQDM